MAPFPIHMNEFANEEVAPRVDCINELPSLGAIWADNSVDPTSKLGKSNFSSSYMSKLSGSSSGYNVAWGNTSKVDPAEVIQQMPGIQQVHRRVGVGAFSHVYQCNVAGFQNEVAVKVISQVMCGSMKYSIGSAVEVMRSNCEWVPATVAGVCPRGVTVKGQGWKKRISLDYVQAHIREASGVVKSPEALLLMQLDHPNLTRLLDCVEVCGTHALVLELCTGGTLSGFLHGNTAQFAKKMNLYKRLKAMIGVISAVAYLHSMGIIHRDVKSNNCLLSHEVHDLSAALPLLKLGDLGLARQNAMGGAMTQGIGTVRYMAPEVISSQNYDYAADIFSLGVMIHEVVSGQVPFESGNEGAVAAAIVQGQRPSNDVLPASAVRINIPSLLDSCWSTSPETRITAQEIIPFLTGAVEWIPEEEDTYQTERSAW